MESMSAIGGRSHTRIKCFAVHDRLTLWCPVRRRALCASAYSSGGEEAFCVEGFSSAKHVIDGPTQPMGQDGDRFSLALFASESVEIFLCRLVTRSKSTAASEKAHFKKALPIFWPE